jgi:hypothetical protein
MKFIPDFSENHKVEGNEVTGIYCHYDDLMEQRKPTKLYYDFVEHVLEKSKQVGHEITEVINRRWNS